MLVTGCGPRTSDTASGKPSGAEDGGTFPITVSSVNGPVTVEEKPERIVALDDEAFDSLLTLGIKPVGSASDVVDRNAAAPWYGEGRLGGVTSIKSDGRVVDYEQVASLAPDLIFGGDKALDQASLSRLSKIAPTAGEFVETDRQTWQSTLTAVGALTGSSVAASTILADVDAQVRDTITDFPDLAGKTAVYAGVYGDNYMAFIVPEAPINQLLAQFGLLVPPGLSGQNQAAISMENYKLLDADLLFMASPNGKRDGIKQAPTLDLIPAVKQGRVSYVGPLLSPGLITPTALSLPYLISDVLAPAFSKL